MCRTDKHLTKHLTRCFGFPEKRDGEWPTHQKDRVSMFSVDGLVITILLIVSTANFHEPCLTHKSLDYKEEQIV